MNKAFLENLFRQASEGGLDWKEAYDKACGALFLDGHDFNLDTTRGLRLGFDEVIFGKGKSAEQILRIAEKYENSGMDFLCTGIDDAKMEFLKDHLVNAEFLPEARMIREIKKDIPKLKGRAAVITAGTSDAYCAYEASETLNSLGIENSVHIDVGVAGIHRFFSIAEEASKADVLIVIAGMEGALPSVAAGIFPQPVIAVPTSVGYGTALNGFTALFAMLTGCAPGVSVVNIDNGFGAAVAAYRIIKRFS